jgi:hypothetical protein
MNYDNVQDTSLYNVRLERKSTGSAVVIQAVGKTTNKAMQNAEDEMGKGWKAVSCQIV